MNNFRMLIILHKPLLEFYCSSLLLQVGRLLHFVGPEGHLLAQALELHQPHLVDQLLSENFKY